MKQINYIGPINTLGYGVASLNVLKSLSEQHQVSLWPIGQPDVQSEGDAVICRQAIQNAKKFSIDAPCFRIWHQNDMAQFAGRGSNVGFPIFELDQFNDVEKHHLASLDGIVVCSEWAASIIRKEIYPIRKVPINVAPLGVDTRIFKPTPNIRTNKTIFFNCGKWEVRKGHDILMRAFNEAFNHTDDVELWMMCSNPFNNAEENAEWHMRYAHPKVRILPRAATHKDVYNVMVQTDCGVFPSRAEGWNLEALEMMAIGRPIIITDYSAHTEYCDKKNSRLIPILETEEARDGKWFHGDGNWAKIGDQQIGLIAAHMREIHACKQAGGTYYNQAGVETAEKFSWKNTAAKMIEGWV